MQKSILTTTAGVEYCCGQLISMRKQSPEFLYKYKVAYSSRLYSGQPIHKEFRLIIRFMTS